MSLLIIAYLFSDVQYDMKQFLHSQKMNGLTELTEAKLLRPNIPPK